MDDMATRPRPPLDDWQIEDARRLKSLFASCGETQDAFGARTGIGGQSLVGQYLNAVIPLNLRIVVKFADGLGVDVADISPTLAEQLPKPRAVFDDFLRSLEQQDRSQVIDFLRWKLENALATRESESTYRTWLSQLEHEVLGKASNGQ